MRFAPWVEQGLAPRTTGSSQILGRGHFMTADAAQDRGFLISNGRPQLSAVPGRFSMA